MSVSAFYASFCTGIWRKGEDNCHNALTPFRPSRMNSHPPHAKRMKTISLLTQSSLCEVSACSIWTAIKISGQNVFSDQRLLKQHVTTLLPLNSVSPALSTDMWEWLSLWTAFSSILVSVSSWEEESSLGSQMNPTYLRERKGSMQWFLQTLSAINCFKIKVLCSCFTFNMLSFQNQDLYVKINCRMFFWIYFSVK